MQTPMRQWDDTVITVRGDLVNASSWVKEPLPPIERVRTGGFGVYREPSFLDDVRDFAVWTWAEVPTWWWFGLSIALAISSYWAGSEWLPVIFGVLALIASVPIVGMIERVLTKCWPVMRWALIAALVGAMAYPFVVDVLAGKANGLFRKAVAAEQGIASVYAVGDKSQPGTTVACPGKRLDDGALTAAHKTLPCGSKVKVTNTKNGLSVVVTIIDRGPFVAGRI
jgi:rare lipoprotein A